MIRPLVFATRNPGKLAELRELLPELHVIDVDEAARELGREIPDVDEDADTFVGNAVKKAREVSAATGLPALADDSGLLVDALGGAPGVLSARYAGPGATAAANNAKLLAALAAVPPPRRAARFHAVLALADEAGPLGQRAPAVITAEGTCEGSIALAPRGTGGFGYDPLFLLPDRDVTMAELERAEKRARSHRGLAVRAIRPQLVAYLAALGSPPA
jgi:XTP/dITP diphosphohydrolase